MFRFSGGTVDSGEETILSPTAIVPPEGGMKPAIILSVVVFPQPDGPSSETSSPSSIVRFRLSTAT
jgi:hypothetical protein